MGPTIGHHVGKASYPQPSAPRRSPDMHRQDWGRFDTLGATYYLAENAETAYAEVLSGFKLPNGAMDPIADIANMLGVSREVAVAWIIEDWELLEADFRGIGAIPAEWRSNRRLFEMHVHDGGWLVDVQHPDSIAAIESSGDGVMSRWLARQGVSALTVST